ncbi:MAG TPA: hypothetical protein VF320_03345, partial [Acidimicrobiales bacterium]
GLVACPDLLPDVWLIADGLGEALADLVEAASRHLHEEAEALRQAQSKKAGKKSTKKAAAKKATKKTAAKKAPATHA